jgi:hypothetical protein
MPDRRGSPKTSPGVRATISIAKKNPLPDKIWGSRRIMKDALTLKYLSADSQQEVDQSIKGVAAVGRRKPWRTMWGLNERG